MGFSRSQSVPQLTFHPWSLWQVVEGSWAEGRLELMSEICRINGKETMGLDASAFKASFWGRHFFCWLALVGILEVLDLEAFRISGLYVYTPQTKATTLFWMLSNDFVSIILLVISSFYGFFVFSTAMNPCHCWRDLKSGWTCRDAGTWRLSWSKDLCNWKFVEALWRLVGWVPGCSLVGAAWFVRNKTRKDFFTKVFLTKVWKGFCSPDSDSYRGSYFQYGGRATNHFGGLDVAPGCHRRVQRTWCHCWVPLQGAIVVCYGGGSWHVVCYGLGVTTNFGGVDGGRCWVPLQGAIVVCHGGGKHFFFTLITQNCFLLSGVYAVFFST